MIGGTFILRALFFTLLIAVLAFGALAAPITMQDDEDGTRKLWDTEFLQQRPANNGPQLTPPRKKQFRYKRITPALPEGGNQMVLNRGEDALIGVTLWRLRAAAASDEKATRLLVQEENSSSGEFVPERVNANELLAEGERVRLTIEVPRAGYLYVIDREKYTDGSYSDPYLIFPTLRTNNGRNEVKAGLAIEIPAQQDNPSYFKLKALDGNAHYAGEMLTVLVSPQPIMNVTTTTGARKITKEQFAEWEKRWGAKTELLALDGGDGKAYTAAEKNAGKSGEKLLTQDDPLPQTLYRIAAKPGDSLLISVPLQIRK